MRVVTKLWRWDQKLHDTLEQLDVTSRQSGNGMIVELPEAILDDPDGNHFLIPPQILPHDPAFFLNEEERGNMVICGPFGNALLPYRVDHHNNVAHFSSRALARVTGYRGQELVFIQKCIIVRAGNTVEIKTEKVWSGTIDSLPEKLQSFRLATRAAVKRANCKDGPNCRHIHFALEQYGQEAEGRCPICGLFYRLQHDGSLPIHTRSYYPLLPGDRYPEKPITEKCPGSESEPTQRKIF